MNPMNFKLFISSILILAFCQTLSSKELNSNKESDSLEPVVKIEEFKNFFKSGNYYFGGQPTLESLDWLKSEGVGVVINLRTEDENEDYANYAYNEENIVKEKGIEYISLPISYPDSYNPETLAQFSEILKKNDGKVFIHCRSCGRVTYFFMAYLVEYKEYSLNEAIEFGKQMKFSFALEDLLGKEIEMTIKE